MARCTMPSMTTCSVKAGHNHLPVLEFVLPLVSQAFISGYNLLTWNVITQGKVLQEKN